MTTFALGSALAADPDGLSGSVQRRVVGTESPLISAAVVDAFVRRLAATTTDDARFELFAWLSGICASYGDVATLREVVLGLPDALARTVREVTELSIPQREVDELSQDVLGIVEASWRPLARVAEEPIDEIDARIDAFIVRLEFRDPLTSEHSRSVAAWCARLGRRLGFDPADVTFVTRCGMLHDVGKAVTPLGILNAPRALDEREWSVMRAHAAAGEAMVRKAPELRPFAPAVRSHHERLDGRGYPDGLPASAIPLTARVVAVADCFNAMIGRRPYRLPMPPSVALDELLRNRGTQFDPEIVDAMVDVVLGKESLTNVGL